MPRHLLVLAVATAVCLAAHLPAPAESTAADSPALAEEEHGRVKRYYGYGGYDYYGGDYWYAGRTIGVIVGVILLLLCCCIPCVCLAGIWFAGWFGIKNARKNKQPQNISYIGSRGDTRGGGYVGPPAAASTSSSAAAAAATTIPISSPPEPAPRTTFAEDAQNHRSYSSDPPPRRFESRRRNSDEFDVVYEAEDRFYSQSTHHSPRDPPLPYRSSRF
ncbi:hypothetical protein PFISCL1PPCAC_20563 [Pristionchus fissidentatus]|uniref:Uncharacterized protein n=1 Tax=Pristionchus fissidentatus TaxID=1538716 RepID=A0AAV5WAI4_9BILA|nr:hypothetical protein PFISCL1PPCAC_20563 [Pristionchus fissidentatus]